uniref:Uncharacterized protein n=1 Tax=Acrobeloides nanus TaxID=290746 RepID=A0A914DHQ9_9BILA
MALFEETSIKKRIALDRNSNEIEVDIIKENIHLDNAGHIVKEKQETHWKVLDFDMLPEWLRDNEYLKSGHRPPLENYLACFKSVFKMHSETGNIWSHLIGCVAFIFIAGYFLVTHSDSHVKLYDKLIFLLFFVSAILCLGLSTLFHTCSCHSAEVFLMFRKLDYLGISVLIVGSFIPWIYYSFYCQIVPKILYISMIVAFGAAVIYMSFSPKFLQHKYRPLRATVFVLMGLSAVFPAIHYLYTNGLHRITHDRFDLLVTMALLYIFGAVLYATRVPERFFPGKCDIWMQSHQLFHLLVVMAAITHYIGTYEMATHRLTGSVVCSS